MAVSLSGRFSLFLFIRVPIRINKPFKLSSSIIKVV